ncbi:hypothetical protein DFS33DRAFT_1489733 [Desarmillaria ectypa]|nr:hypothetical protein DFS33DRAFT_1489733 [Desarmillaria ectypa]
MHRQPSKPLPTTTAPITPSLSPPQSPSFFSARWRTPGSVPPPKRRRLSTPGRAASSSVQDQFIDFDQARAESERRLLDVWDRLAERYSRRIDEDDIIDIVTGDVIKDRGVLRSMGRWEVGRFADEDEGNDDRSTGEEEEVLEEESTDELDCLGDSAEEADLSLLGRSVIRSRAIDPDDPDDAELLKEFSEAERRRKEICGSEEEDVYTADDADHSAQNSDHRADSDDESDDEVQVLESAPHTPSQDHVSDSDDDFCPWGEDDVYLPVEVTEIENIEPDVIPKLLSSPPAAPPSPNKPNKPLRKSSTSPAKPTKNPPRPPPPQLQTPPRSSSSVPPAEVEDIEPFAIPLLSPSPTPTCPESERSVSHPRTRSSGLRPKPSKSRTLFRVEDSETPPPRLDLTTMSIGNKRPSPIKALKKTKSQAVVAGTPQPQSTVQERRLKTEVVIVEQPRSQSRAREVEGGRRTERGQKILKGKGKLVLTPEKVDEKKTPQQRSYEVHNLDLGYDSDSPGVGTDTSAPSSPLKGKGKAVAFTASSRGNQTSPRKRIEDLAPTDENVTRKRKRVSDIHVDPGSSKLDISSRYSRSTTPAPVSDRESSVEEIERTPPKQNIMTKRRSKTKLRSPESDDEVYSFHRHSPPPRRSQSHFNPPPPSEHYYPYPPAYPPREHGPPYVPLYDPRAQYIISQAMHQLSALAGSWSGVERHPLPPVSPYTPSRHRGFSGSASSSMYNTPTQRMHPHPYEFDPNLSRATLPPSSPDVQSSPAPERVQTSSRASSLVTRSRSRGRRVSFRIEEEADIVELDSTQVSPPPGVRDQKDARHSVRQDKGKGKARFEEVIDDSESEPFVKEPIRRGRSVGRAQTPAPQGPSRIPSEPPRRGRSLSARPIDSRPKSRSTH